MVGGLIESCFDVRIAACMGGSFRFTGIDFLTDLQASALARNGLQVSFGAKDSSIIGLRKLECRLSVALFVPIALLIGFGGCCFRRTAADNGTVESYFEDFKVSSLELLGMVSAGCA